MVPDSSVVHRFRCACAAFALRPGLARAGLLGLALLCLTVPGSARSTGSSGSGAEEARDRFDTVVIDPGHGGEDHGARGRTGLVEKEIVADVAGRLATLLREQGLNVVLTREDDSFVPLEVRTSIANDARADLFVSIHANASLVRGARGAETFFASLEATDDAARELALLENAAFGEHALPEAAADPLVAILGDLIATEHLTDSQEFARMAQHALTSEPGSRSRGVKQAPFVVLLGVQMPAVLVEVGFLSNGAEEQVLKRSAERQRIAVSLAAAVADFRERYDARRGVDLPASEAE